jgi:hypothetical protein
MLRSVTSFRGEVPLVTPRALPEGASQAAVNSRLYTGDLTAFKQFSLTEGLANTGPVQTISLMAAGTPYEVWLSWDQQVDVARGTVPGDTTYRTYLTGLDAPRFTNLALATTGGPPYPGMTRLLGVPPPDTVPSLVVGVDPTPTTFSVDIYDDCSDLSTNWAISPGQVHSGTYVSEVLQDAAFGNPAPSFQVGADNNNSTPAYASRDFGTSGATVIHASWDFNARDLGSNTGFVIPFMFACDATGNGPRILAYGTVGGPIEIGIAVGTGFAAGNGSLLASGVGTPGSCGVLEWYTVDATFSVNANGTMTIDANISLGSAQLASVTTTNTFTYGGVFGPMVAKGNDYLQVNYDNILVQAAGSLGTTITDIATSYVYTFVNDLGEESAPSLPSATILRPDGISVTVTTPTSLPSGVSESDYFVVTKRIYRAATGSTGTAFLSVAEIPLSQADYVDVLTDSALGEVLPSDIWELPPSDLRGILALPNGVMVGFSKNQLCLSAQNYPHAWPVSYRLDTDTDIVGIGNIDTTVVIGTQSFLYVASGNDPASYSMSKFEVPHAASSLRSFAYITGLGVVFSGPQGLMVVRGIGQASNLTEEVFTLRQWKALDPTSIFSVAHDDIYFMFWDNGVVAGCYAVDLRTGGFGVAEMAFHATAAYVDPITDTMYLVLDQDNEPDTAVLPFPPSAPVYMDSKTIYEFEGDPTSLMTYRWRTKLWLEPYPAFHSIAQVRAESYNNLVARFYGDGVMLDEIVIEGEVEFTLTPPDAAYSTFEMELIGTDTVRELMAADDVLELDGLSQVQQYNTVGAG